MKYLYQYFFRGLLAALPLGLTIYLLYVFLSWTEQFALWWLRPLIGDFSLPGLGLLIGIGVIVLLGFVISQPYARRLLTLIELPFTNLPLVKSIYSSLKNFADYFAPNSEQRAHQVVILSIPGNQLEIVGLITRQSVRGLPEGFQQGDRVGVYLPMGYMIGGYTVFVPRSWLTPIDMTVEEVMRSSLFAWMAKNDRQPDENAE
ncbi:MAG: DUF502 domain-containing protein [Rhodocyclaceae bacterium]